MRVRVAAGIYDMVGYHLFWTEVMVLLEMECPLKFKEYLLLHNTNKVKKWVREHTNSEKAKQKLGEHNKLRSGVD